MSHIHYFDFTPFGFFIQTDPRFTSYKNFISSDYVGEGLGGNSGVNGQASIIDRVNLINTLRLLTGDWSPHSSYDPTKYIELKDVIGYKK